MSRIIQSDAKADGSKRKIFIRMLNVLKKLENRFSADYNLMLQCSEQLIKEITLGSPRPASVSHWVLRWTKVSLSAAEARSLLSYVSLQLAKQQNLKHCPLLPPSPSEQEGWLRELCSLAERSSGGGSTFREERGGALGYSLARQSREQPQEEGSTKLAGSRATRGLRGAEDPTLLMFPALPGASPAQQQAPRSILKKPKPTLPSSDSNSSELSPIRFKKTSTSMAYKKYGMSSELEEHASVADMVALAKRKQRQERQERQYKESCVEEMSFGKNSIDYGLQVQASRAAGRGSQQHHYQPQQQHEQQQQHHQHQQQHEHQQEGRRVGVRSEATRLHRDDHEGGGAVIQGVRADRTLRTRKY